MKRTARRAGWVMGAMLALAGCVQSNADAIEDGVVLSAQPIGQPGRNTGVGAVAGLVVGAGLGSAGGQVGEAVGGAVVGSIVGSAAESASQTHDGIEYAVRLTDGRVVTIIEHIDAGARIFAVGDAVGVRTNGSEQEVVARPPG